MIAMALACEPKLLIADEPTTALDVTIQAQILDLIDQLRQELHMAVVLITHDMGVIAGRTDRVLVMYAGKIAEGAATNELFTRHAPPLFGGAAGIGSQARPGPLGTAGEHSRTPARSLRAHHPMPLRSSLSLRPGRLQGIRNRPWSKAPTPHPATWQLASTRWVWTPPPSPCNPRPWPCRSTPAIKVDPEAQARQLARAESILREPVLLEVDHVVKEFPVTSGVVIQRKVGSVKAVSDVSFAVRTGETFGLVGESGCGKTTLGRLVVALERVNAGAIRFDGEDLTRLGSGALRHRRRDLQIMFQDPYASLDPRMKVGTILREPLVVQGIGTAEERTKRVEELLTEVGLSKRAVDLYPHEFSGGQRQRIGLARALTLDPRLIVADEPVSALDVSIQAQILNLLKELQSRRGLTYIFISHDLAVVKYVADTIGVMYLGKLVEVGPGRDIYEKAAHPYTKALIDTIPVADVTTARETRGKHIQGELPSAITPPTGCRFRTRCEFAQDICAEEEPKLRPFGDRHLAACHFPLQTPTGTAPDDRVPVSIS